jgi:protein SCO1/2
MLAIGSLLGLGGCREPVRFADVALAPTAEAELREPRGRASDRFSNIWLTTQHGERVRFYDDLVRDRVVLINFMYTTCPLICPGTAAQLSRLNDLFGEHAGRDIRVLSISIDPEVDTADKLKAYWEAFGSKPGWLFLTGDYDEIDRLRHELGVYDPDPIIDADKTQHAGIVTFGNDRTDRWAALPALTNLNDLARAIRRFTWDDQWGASTNSPPVAASSGAHPGSGIVRELRPDRGQAVIEHGDIPGLMGAMTMAFEVPDPKLLEGLQSGQLVDFELEYNDGHYQIIKISALPE